MSATPGGWLVVLGKTATLLSKRTWPWLSTWKITCKCAAEATGVVTDGAGKTNWLAALTPPTVSLTLLKVTWPTQRPELVAAGDEKHHTPNTKLQRNA